MVPIRAIFSTYAAISEELKWLGIKQSLPSQRCFVDEWHIPVWLESYKVQNLGTANTFQWSSNLQKSLLANSSDEPKQEGRLQARPSDQTGIMVRSDHRHVQRQDNLIS